MSEPASALDGASYEGIVAVRVHGSHGMITLRGDLASTRLKEAVTNATGAALPETRKIVSAGDDAVAWMSPDELLLLTDHGRVAETLATLKNALQDEHFLAVDVSDARAMFEIQGPIVREIIAKLCPVDMAQGSFGPGDFRRTRMAQVAAAFWMVDETCIRIVCFRSVADYVLGLLKDAAAPGGEVGIFT